MLYLKLQMSPHFLFNTLNNIYALSLNESTKTATAVSQLKELIQYVKQLEERKTVSLHEEINYLKNYISLNQMRFNLPVHFEVENENNSTQIEPMLLQSFIENAFKHGNTDKACGIDVSLINKKDTVLFQITNTIGKNKRKDNVGGIGLQNIKKRLELSYPNRHELKISQDENSYSVSLKLITTDRNT